MRYNYLGIIGTILAFVSSILPWWASHFAYPTPYYSFDLLFYLGQGITSNSFVIIGNSWFGWGALAFVVLGGLLSLAGSIINSSKNRLVLALGGILVLTSIIVFVIGFQVVSPPASNLVVIPQGLFSSGSFSWGEVGNVAYYSYLSFGFWFALAAAIIMFAALKINPTFEEPNQRRFLVNPPI